MLPSSVRRVASSAISSAPQTGVISALASSAPKAIPVFLRNQQRRCSSSKPSRSDNGSSEISAGQSVPASTTSPKSGTEKRKRKSSKDASERAASVKKLPSVPNTHHMSQEGRSSGVSMADFVWHLLIMVQLSVYQVSSRYIGPSRSHKRCPEP